MTSSSKSKTKISLAQYGPPPELPSADDIMEDIGKASLNDIVFKSSNESGRLSKHVEESLLDVAENGNSTSFSAEDNRDNLTPKLAYEMSVKLLEKQRVSKTLLKSLDEHAGSLNSLKEEIIKHLDRLEKDKQTDN